MTEDLALIDIDLVRDTRLALHEYLCNPSEGGSLPAMERLHVMMHELTEWLEDVQSKTMKKATAMVRLPDQDKVQEAFDAFLENGIAADSDVCGGVNDLKIEDMTELDADAWCARIREIVAPFNGEFISIGECK